MRLFITFLLASLLCQTCSPVKRDYSLRGNWKVMLDSLDRGEKENWYSQRLGGVEIKLPGSLNQNGIGDDIHVNTQWVGEILDSAWYFEEKYAKYRQPGNIKIPFWLQPNKRYVGVAWYQKEFEISKEDTGKPFKLFLERPHWQTKVWVDSTFVGEQNSLATPHEFLIPSLSKGKHVLTIRIDNRLDVIDPGHSAHSLSDNTQTNWHGMVGKIRLTPSAKTRIDNARIYPSFSSKSLNVSVKIEDEGGNNTTLATKVYDGNQKEILRDIRTIKPGWTGYQLDFGEVRPWDEFDPYLYSLELVLENEGEKDTRKLKFGFRDVERSGRQILVNDRPVFLRGTLDCAIFPNTGYPPTDVDPWKEIFTTVKNYGLNHVRYHSWCPPRAAFSAADELGVYLQVEASAWANTKTTTIGDGKPIDEWIFKEAGSILETYGHHPSFLLMAYGNEPGGKNQVAYLEDFVSHFQKVDSTKLYTGGAGWPFVSNMDYYNHFAARIQRWGEGLNSIINSQPPQSVFDYDEIIQSVDMPYVSHEIGQWCVYPNFGEIEKYTGELQPNNYRIFQETLEEAGLINLDSQYVMASGKLQALCYKADIEAALRTKEMAGFQLLGLQDFPGQGTAIIGVVDPFWEEKPYINAGQFKAFCDTTVLLARFPKFIYSSDETLGVAVEAAHFGRQPIKKDLLKWNIRDKQGNLLASNEKSVVDIDLGNAQLLDSIQWGLNEINQPAQLRLTASLGRIQNSWDFWVYPAGAEERSKDQTRVVSNLDRETLQYLEKGGKVLWSISKNDWPDSLGGEVGLGFSSIFWNTSYTSGQEPHTLGILCDPDHPAFSLFPTEYHSNWQWWDPIKNGTAINLSYFSHDIEPIVRIIDDWNENRNLALLFEVKVGEGKLLISGIDFLVEDLGLSLKQLLMSLKEYIRSEEFQPIVEVELDDFL